jgi:hypothetical protein
MSFVLHVNFNDEDKQLGVRYLEWIDNDRLIQGRGGIRHLVEMARDENLVIKEPDMEKLRAIKPGEEITITLSHD